MARIALVRILRSLPLVTLGGAIVAATPGCGGSAEEVAYDAGSDAPPVDAGSLPDARDLCDPVVLSPTGDDPCELALPGGFLPARVYYDEGDDTVVHDLLPEVDECQYGTTGFYADDQNDPTTITLCPEACRALPDPLPEIQATACGV